MKKILFLSIILSLSAIAWSQSVTIKGAYKGQPLKVDGRYLPDGTVNITSFSYAPFDKLESEVKTLQTQKKNLEEEKKKIEEEKKRLEDKVRELENENESLKKQIRDTGKKK